MAKDLVKIIKENPGCFAIIDNDSWSLYRDENHYNEEDAEPIASYDDIEPLGDGGYGSGNCYGGDLLQALAIIVGMKVESV